jgi:uncharacterized membrane protein YfcA
MKPKTDLGERKIFIILALMLLFGAPSFYLSLTEPISETFRWQVPLLTIETILCFLFRKETIIQGAEKISRPGQAYIATLVFAAAIIGGLLSALFTLMMVYAVLFISSIFTAKQVNEDNEQPVNNRSFKSGPDWPVKMEVLRN